MPSRSKLRRCLRQTSGRQAGFSRDVMRKSSLMLGISALYVTMNVCLDLTASGKDEVAPSL